MDIIKSLKVKVLGRIENLILDLDYSDLIEPINKPKVSVISSVFKGEKFIKGMVESFLSQTYENKELIIIDCSPDDLSHNIIKDLLDKEDNIRFFKIKDRITPMKAFNIAEQEAHGEIIAICLVDDRLAPDYLEICAKVLLYRPDIDLVYGDSLVTKKPNENFLNNSSFGELFEHSKFSFSKENMIKSLPGPCPAYRKNKSLTNKWNEDITHAR